MSSVLLPPIFTPIVPPAKAKPWPVSLVIGEAHLLAALSGKRPIRPVLSGGNYNAVTKWFADGIARLHPRLQALHKLGGTLVGVVEFKFCSGLAGVLGRHLARHLGIPDTSGTHGLAVQIVHSPTTMMWNRCFNETQRLSSSFQPTGCWPDGRWLERTGPMTFSLKVTVIDGGWYWHIVGARLHNMPMPLWLLPRVVAYKRIEADKYRFFVGFSLPVIGELFSYSGLLELYANG